MRYGKDETKHERKQGNIKTRVALSAADNLYSQSVTRSTQVVLVEEVMYQVQMKLEARARVESMMVVENEHGRDHKEVGDGQRVRQCNQDMGDGV